MLPHLGVFILSSSKRIMNKLVFAIVRIKHDESQYPDIDSLYIDENIGQFWNKNT